MSKKYCGNRGVGYCGECVEADLLEVANKEARAAYAKGRREAFEEALNFWNHKQKKIGDYEAWLEAKEAGK